MNKTEVYGERSEIAVYVSQKIREDIPIDGDLNKPVWQKAVKSNRFVDMADGGPAMYDTRAAVLWSDEKLYIAFWAEEPYVSAAQTERDSLIFLDNDLEVFIDGGDAYYELEINALNTLYEVFFIWKDAYQKGGRFDVPEFDVYKEKAMTFGGNYDRNADTFWWGTHPRGLRWAFLDYDLPGLETAVRIDGKINDSSQVDKGWTLEIAIPWQSLKWLANGRSLPPQDGDDWRIFFGRFEKLMAAGQEMDPHPAWAMNKHGVYDTHIPESFSRVLFKV